ncbi:MAG: 16S rRNA (adenine(1518)-N(6)/adenine(1519)-N(6))-dimethyltransferase RsmA [Chloroflexota bacterium]
MNSSNPYLRLQRIRAALRSLDLRPSRGMGQNFLTSPQVLETIVSAAQLQDHDLVLEIGPGLGVLTWELLSHVAQVVSVELDKRLAARLREEFSEATNLTIVQGDILDLAPHTLVPQMPSEQTAAYKVVANLPYAITSPVLRHLLEAEYRPDLIVVLVQWEVAKRITAQPGALSVLAHSVQLYAEPEIIARVASDSFFPEPEVDSAVLRLRVRRHPALSIDQVDQLMRVIKAGFLHSRKKLLNALPGGFAAFGMRIAKEQIAGVLEAAQVDPGRRAETVTLEEWVSIYRRVYEILGEEAHSKQ